MKLASIKIETDELTGRTTFTHKVQSMVELPFPDPHDKPVTHVLLADTVFWDGFKAEPTTEERLCSLVPAGTAIILSACDNYGIAKTPIGIFRF